MEIVRTRTMVQGKKISMCSSTCSVHCTKLTLANGQIVRVPLHKYVTQAHAVKRLTPEIIARRIQDPRADILQYSCNQ